MRAPSTPAATLRPGTRTILVVWIALAAITVIAWRLTPDHVGAASLADRELVTAIVVLGMVKSRLIICYFMEVRTAPRWLQIATDAWIVVLWSALLAIHLCQ
jgi:hypothetical protein